MTPPRIAASSGATTYQRRKSCTPSSACQEMKRIPAKTSNVPAATASVIFSPRKKMAIAALQSGTDARIGPLRAAPIFSMPM